MHPDFWSLTNNVVSLCQGCGLGRAAREAGLHPVPPETLPRNAKAPAAHRQRGVRPFYRLFTGLPFSAVCWVCCHIVTFLASYRTVSVMWSGFPKVHFKPQSRCYFCQTFKDTSNQFSFLVVIEYQDGHLECAWLLLIMLHSDFIELLPIGLIINNLGFGCFVACSVYPQVFLKPSPFISDWLLCLQDD